MNGAKRKKKCDTIAAQLVEDKATGQAALPTVALHNGFPVFSAFTASCDLFALLRWHEMLPKLINFAFVQLNEHEPGLYDKSNPNYDQAG
jgi:hypothetical protein